MFFPFGRVARRLCITIAYVAVCALLVQSLQRVGRAEDDFDAYERFQYYGGSVTRIDWATDPPGVYVESGRDSHPFITGLPNVLGVTVRGLDEAAMHAIIERADKLKFLAVGFDVPEGCFGYSTETALDDRYFARICRSCKNLERLVVNASRLTDGGLEALSDQSQLRSLYLWNGRCPPESLARLVKMKRLREISLIDCRLTNRHLEALSQAVGLEDVYICGAGATDDGIRHLLKLPRLSAVTLHETGATVDSVHSLAQKRSVKRIDAFGPTLTREMERAIGEGVARPDLTVGPEPFE